MAAKTDTSKEGQEPEAADPVPVAMPLEFHMIQDPNIRAAFEHFARGLSAHTTRIEALEKAVKEGKRRDHPYKGDRYHLWVREKVLRLCDEVVAVRYRDVKNYPALQGGFQGPNGHQPFHIYTLRQWIREVDQNLTKGRPMARSSDLYCAIEIAATRAGMSVERRPAWVEATRRKFAEAGFPADTPRNAPAGTIGG